METFAGSQRRARARQTREWKNVGDRFDNSQDDVRSSSAAPYSLGLGVIRIARDGSAARPRDGGTIEHAGPRLLRKCGASEKIDVSKMNPTGILVDKYSYMAQPYSFYYFHHIDELGFRNHVVKRGKDIYPLKDPGGAFAATYNWQERSIRSTNSSEETS
jgi:hypothetical protein